MTDEWVIVPREPTEAMLLAAGKSPSGLGPRGGVDYLGRMLPRYYRAMLAAAPALTPAEPGVVEAKAPFATVSPYGEIGRRGSPLAYLIDPGAGSGSDCVTRYWPTRGELDDIERRGGSITPLYAVPVSA